MPRIRVRDTHTELYSAGRGGEKSQQRECLLVKVAFGDPQRFVAGGLSQGSVFPELWTTLNTVIEHHTKSSHVRPPRLSLQRIRGLTSWTFPSLAVNLRWTQPFYIIDDRGTVLR